MKVKVFIHIILFIGLILMSIPFLWMILTSFKPQDEVLQIPLKWLPTKFEFSNYRQAWESAPFGRYFFNSILITVITVFGQIWTSALAGYAFAKMKFTGKNLIFYIFLGTMMIPLEITLIPNYILMKKLGWLNTYFALIVPWFASVFGIFLMRQFFKTVPQELFEAAQMDGCGHWSYLWKILFPISTPVFVSVGIFSMISTWNSFLWPLIMANSTNMRTLPVGLAYFTLEFSTRYHLLMAAATMAILPVALVYFLAQRYFIQGIARTGLG